MVLRRIAQWALYPSRVFSSSSSRVLHSIQSAVTGRTFSLGCGIEASQLRHIPYLPWLMRSSVSSILLRSFCSRSLSFNTNARSLSAEAWSVRSGQLPTRTVLLITVPASDRRVSRCKMRVFLMFSKRDASSEGFFGEDSAAVFTATFGLDLTGRPALGLVADLTAAFFFSLAGDSALDFFAGFAVFPPMRGPQQRERRTNMCSRMGHAIKSLVRESRTCGYYRHNTRMCAIRRTPDAGVKPNESSIPRFFLIIEHLGC